MTKKSNKKDKESEVVQAARKIMEAKNEDFEVWKKRKISERKLRLLDGDDPKWELDTLEEECQIMITKEVLIIVD